MERIKQLLKELNRLLNTLSAAIVLINSVLVFLAVYFLLSFIRFRPGLALVPAVFYMFLTLTRRLAAPKLDLVEKTYPYLRGKLSTAADNSEADSPIATELEEECITDIRNVKTTDFIDFSSLLKKTTLIIVTCFAILIISSYNISLTSTLEEIKNVLGITGRFGFGGTSGSDPSDDKQPFNLYDESATNAFMGTDAVSLEIPVPESVKVDETTSVKDRDFEETFPQELFSQGSEAYSEDIADEHRAIIKQYFSSVSKR